MMQLSSAIPDLTLPPTGFVPRRSTEAGTRV
jgi:hypothetical protein